MELKEKKKLACEIAKILIQNNAVKPVSDENQNLKFEIDGELFYYHELCHYFYIEIDNFDRF